MRIIDLNADLGEGCGNDREILKYVSSANIACGLHAGSPGIMADTIRLALKNDVSIGAHPGYPDRKGFGRSNMDFSFNELMAILLYQIGALNAIARSEGGKLSHIKAHGALYNSAAIDQNIATAIVKASKEINPELSIFGLKGSYIESEALKEDMTFCSEVFADRAYMADGSLVPRSIEGAIIENKEECASRTLSMIKNNYVMSLSGEKLKIKADTVCLHGDNESALDFARYLYNKLIDNNIQISSNNL